MLALGPAQNSMVQSSSRTRQSVDTQCVHNMNDRGKEGWSVTVLLALTEQAVDSPGLGGPSSESAVGAARG